MKHCPKCNVAVKDHHRFCEECGADLKKRIIRKAKIKTIKKVEKKEMNDSKKQMEDSKKEAEQALKFIKDVHSEFTKKKQGHAAVLIGIVIALILGMLANIYNWEVTWLWSVLAIGALVGSLNIFYEDGVLFPIVLLTTTLMLNLLTGLSFFPSWLVTLFNAVIYLLAPATILISLKVFYVLAVK